MTYGSSPPAVTATYSGFVNGDTPASLTTAPTCTTTATSTSPAGTYPTTCTGAADANYTITYTTGAITVQAPLSQAPAITSGASTTFVVGTTGSFTVTTSGMPAPTFTQSGALPAGVTFTDNGNGTATIAGTPAVGTDGVYQLAITAQNGVSPPANQAFTLTAEATSPGGLVPLTPARVLDTRSGIGGITGPVGGHQTVSLAVLGHGGVPASGVGAVVLNVTVTQPTTAGVLTVYPAGVAAPTSSNLNFVTGQTVPNLVIAPVGANGQVNFFNNSVGSVQIIADVSGWFAAGSPAAGGLAPITPARVLDTRSGIGGITGPVGGHQTVSLAVLGQGGVPASGVGAVVLNVTVTQPTTAGVLTVYPAGVAAPTSSNLNFVTGQTVPNLVIAPVGANGQVNFFNNSVGSVQIIADVSGWFAAGSPAAGGLAPITPARVLDTRSGIGGITGPVGGHQTVSLAVLGQGGVPASGVGAVVLNVTVTQPTTAGVLTVYPAGVAAPTSSNLNFVTGQTVPNLVIAPVGANGQVNLFNNSVGSVQIIADVSGWFANPPS